MLTINDRDLAAVDPWVFVDARSAGTTLADGSNASMSEQALTHGSSTFADAGVKAGHVVVVGGEALEVTARLGQTSLMTTRVRAAGTDDEIPPAEGTGLAFHVTTFDRIVAIERTRLLGSLRLDDATAAGVEGGGGGAIIDEAPLLELIVLRSIATAYEQAAAREPDSASLAARVALWRTRANEAAERTATAVDVDGDGEPEGTRRTDVIVLRRS